MAKHLVALFFVSVSYLWLLCFADSKLPQHEVDALEQISTTMGAKYWEFDANNCEIRMVGMTTDPPQGAQRDTLCDCTFQNHTVCHVVSIMIKGYSLPGSLPPQLVKLPYLKEVDFALNCLTGTIPQEWASSRLTSLSVLVNRLSGEIPLALSNMTTLTYLNMEANQFSGVIPPELGRLINLQTLVLSSNQLTGNLPTTFAELKNLTDFRINDNNFSGSIPEFIQNWENLGRLEMHGSGLEGPIPSNISELTKLTMLRISDMPGPEQSFPMVEQMEGLLVLVLRYCNITGGIPSYIWTMKTLDIVDFSFNKLDGEIQEGVRHRRILFLTDNLLSGTIPVSILRGGTSIDLSYNRFSLQKPDQPTCQQSMNLNLNLFRSSSMGIDLKGLPCLKEFKCPRYSNCWSVNSGGNDITIRQNNTKLEFQGDGDVDGGIAKYYLNDENYWGLSSTGDFMDDNDFQNIRYTVNVESSNIPELYRTARIAAISLTYFHRCLENGNYTANLHFAEIQFTNDQTFKSLGRRIFDIYVQERLVFKDFNIEAEAGTAEKPVVIPVRNVSVTNNELEIRLYFSGKGTTRIPERGVYGPIISAISVVSDSSSCSYGGDAGKNKTAYIIIGAVVGGFCIFFLLFVFIFWKGCLPKRGKRKQDLKGLELQTRTFTLKQIIAATDDFDYANKIGEGGFGPVHKGILPDGTVIAVKQLSAKSRQGNREFLNEIGMISCVQHPNLVKLYGCCIESDQLMLVYEYMENNSLFRALFGPGKNLKLDWPTRHRICIGIARGLAFLHEEARLKIVHRDIKATNVLLDANLNPKISDFGLARLDEEEKTHITTRIAGTIGYMAPEYALWGHLTYKADVYSFGVVVLEVVSGKNNNNYLPSDDYVCLLDWACQLLQSGNLVELIDENLGSGVDRRQAELVLKVVLLCTSATASLRPTMSEVVSMLEERMPVPEVDTDQTTFSGDLRFKAMRDLHQERQRQRHSQNFTASQTHNSSGNNTCTVSSPSDNDFREIITQPTCSPPKAESLATQIHI